MFLLQDVGNVWTLWVYFPSLYLPPFLSNTGKVFWSFIIKTTTTTFLGLSVSLLLPRQFGEVGDNFGVVIFHSRVRFGWSWALVANPSLGAWLGSAWTPPCEGSAEGHGMLGGAWEAQCNPRWRDACSHLWGERVHRVAHPVLISYIAVYRFC